MAKLARIIRCRRLLLSSCSKGTIMALTAAQAATNLASVSLIEDLCALIAQIDIAARGTETVLYSGAKQLGSDFNFHE
jgi:hypothetical protein